MFCLSWTEIQNGSGAGFSRPVYWLSQEAAQGKEEDGPKILWPVPYKKMITQITKQDYSVAGGRK